MFTGVEPVEGPTCTHWRAETPGVRVVPHRPREESECPVWFHSDLTRGECGPPRPRLDEVRVNPTTV